jgi:RND family efflux transporter MFP subunit
MRSFLLPLGLAALFLNPVFTQTLAGAAERPAKFAVSQKQMQALGIQTTPLQNQADSVRPNFPAQVVVSPDREQVASSPVAGLISQILVQPNEMVRRGAALVRIASPELGQLQLQLLQAAARATLARQAAQREQALFDEGIIPQRRVQEAQAALKEGEAALRQAKAALRLSGMPIATIDQVAASGLPQDSITLHAAQAGVVTSIEVKPGQRVDSASALLHIVQIGRLLLDIQVPVAEAGNWKPGSKLRIQGHEIGARLVSASTTVAANSQTVALRAVIEAGTNHLRPGEFVTVELPAAGTVQGAWDVPLAAIVHDGKQAYLFVRTAEGFEARPVSVIAGAGQRARVQGAVKVGEQIAISGAVALKGSWMGEKGAD